METRFPVLRSSLERLHDEIESVFENWMPRRREREETKEMARPNWWGSTSLFEAGLPAIDMEEDEKELRVTAEMPGLDKDDFKVELTGNRLVIRGEKKGEQEKKEKNFYYAERTYGSFSRSVTLPADVDPGKIEALYKDGVLRLRLPKTEQFKARSVKVKVA